MVCEPGSGKGSHMPASGIGARALPGASNERRLAGVIAAGKSHLNTEH
jgi:hypothetical protein